MRKKILKLLFRSLDEPLGKKDRELLARHLEGSAELRRAREDLLALRRDIAASGTASFRPGFAERTMARARALGLPGRAENGFIPALLAMAKRFAVVGVILLVIVVSYFLINRDLIPEGAAYYLSDLSLTRILQFPVF
jgi:hypothetical protein